MKKYIEENKGTLPEGVAIDLNFEDLEKEASWKKIDQEKTYDRIIAHYVFDELKDPEALIAKASKLLGKGGFFSVNGPDVCDWEEFYKNAMKEAGIEASFIDEAIDENEEKRDAFREMVGKYFSKVDIVALESSFRFDKADDIFEWMQKRYETQTKFFASNQNKIKEYFADKIAKEGEIIITTTSHFLHCSV